MTDSTETTPSSQADPFNSGAPQTPPPPYGAHAHVPAPYGGHLAANAAPGMTARAPIGRIRGTGGCIALSIVTFGIYTLYWFYSVHAEMKRHSGQGIDGGLALVLAFFVRIIMPFVTSSEIGTLYERANLRKPVSGATGLWYFPGVFILIGPLVWFIKTNGALNNYWRMHGAA